MLDSQLDSLTYIQKSSFCHPKTNYYFPMFSEDSGFHTKLDNFALSFESEFD